MAVLPRHLQLLSWFYLIFFCSLLSRTLSCSSDSSSSSSSSSWRSSSSSSSSSNANRNPHYTSHSDLNDLYNKPVQQAEKVSRPLLPGPLSEYGRHEGVRVTTQDGERWLVHKGSGYGDSGGDTVVVPADDMSSNWRVDEARRVQNARVGDYVKSGGKNYDLIGDNCQDAADRMMENRK